MAEWYGKARTREEIAARTGALAQIAGVELLEFADGPERGVRLLEFRTGGGLGFRIAVDRGFDLLSAEYRGIPIGWRSPVGPRHPALASVEENRGWGFLRSFTGLLATCGLDHALAPATGSLEQYIYPGYRETDHPLHGRISQIPARLLAYGERWQGGRCLLFAEAEVAQMAVFGENLVLTRRIEAALGGTAISVADRVENRGYRPTPHMLLYHYNFGWPVLDEGAELLLPSRAVVHTVHEDLHAQGVGWRIQGAPVADFREQVYEHDVVAGADGMAMAALVNRRLGLGVRLDYDHSTLPCLTQWQCLQSGLYVLGIEPTTNHVGGRKLAEARGELIALEHGEVREYRTRLAVLDGAAAIAEVEGEIERLQPPPPDFAPPTGELAQLGGRS